MDYTQLLLGIALMILGTAFVMAAVVSSLRHERTWGVHELWLLPLVGVVLMLVGRWVIQ